MPVGTAFHPRTFACSESLGWKDWSGYFAATSYEVLHDHEYNAIRQSAALIDVSPLFKYMVRGRDAVRLIDRVITRDVHKMKLGQVVYTHWCDGHGKMIDDGTVSRLDEQLFRWTAAEPTLRWILQNADGLSVEVEDVSETTAALALQGPTSRAVLQSCCDLDMQALRYFRVASTTIAGVSVDVSRTGYTGDLGYEIWVDAARAPQLWDALVEAGRPYGIKPAGLLALDVARIEAGLILLNVDYVGTKTALIPSDLYTPFELGLGRLVHVDKAPFVGQEALRREKREGSARQLIGVTVDWNELEELYDAAGLPPQIPSVASRLSVPLYRDGRQVGQITSSTWSPTLKKMIGIGTVETSLAEAGTRLRMEHTVDHRRMKAGVVVTPLPFFDPPRKRS